MDGRSSSGAESSFGSNHAESADRNATGLANSAATSLRLDGPHFEHARQAPAAVAPKRDSQVLLQASQMLQQLQQDLAAQEQREAEINARELQFAEREQAFELWSRRIRTELEERRAALLASESTLAQRLAALDDRLRDVDQQTEALREQQASIEAERIATAHETALRTAVEQAELNQLRQQLADEWTKLEIEKASLQEQQASSREQLATELSDERQKLVDALAVEWKQQRDAFEAERSAWEQQRATVEQELAQRKLSYDSALQALDTQLNNRRAAFEAEFQQLRSAAEIALQAERSAWELAQRTAIADQQKDRVQLETRLRFQQEHLEKVRAELEQQQQEFRHERQLLRQQLEDDTAQLERRREQLKLYQQSLDERTQSLDRERDTLQSCRQAWDSTFDADREALESERQAWDDERRHQQLELQRQRDVLASHSESLERKRSRLERLRVEIEDTHRTTLELRLAVEETWAQIADALGGDEEARIRVDQSRQALVFYYQELHAAIEAQREELQELQSRFDHQRLTFHDERQTLMQWLTERDESLRAEEIRQRQAAAEMSVREVEWRHQRDLWLAEKLEAESTIRRLLEQLASDTATEQPSPSTVAPQTVGAAALGGPHFALDRRMATANQPQHN